MLLSIDRKSCFVAVDGVTFPSSVFEVVIRWSQPAYDPPGLALDHPVRDEDIEFPVQQLRLLAVRKSLMKPAEGGLGYGIWFKRPGFRAVRMFSDYFVFTGTAVFAEFVLDDSGWNWKEEGQ